MKIIYKNGDSVCVLHPSPKWKGTMEALAAKDIPEGCEFKIVRDDKVPGDRAFRNAWEYDKGAIRVDIPKAQWITKERLRAERKPLLEALDVDALRALEGGMDLTQIKADKQKLRDVTNQVDFITDLGQLKALKAGS